MSHKSERTKKNIKECSKKLFIKQGFNQTSVRQIVHMANVAKGTFYLYYETKMQVFKELVREQMLKNFRLADNHFDYKHPSLDQLNYFIDKIVMLMETNREEMFFFHKESTLEIIIENRLDKEVIHQMIYPIERFIEAGIRKGVFTNLDSQLYGKILYGIVHEMLESAFLYEYPAKLGVIQQEVKFIIKCILTPSI